MSEAAIRTGIYDFIRVIPDIGVVHDYERWAVDQAKILEFYKTTIGGKPQIRGWEVTRRAAKGDDSAERQHTYAIKGYQGLKDDEATEKLFNANIEAIEAKFREDQTIGGTALGHEFIQVELIQPRMFGGTLCHYAELSLVVWDLIA